MQPKLQPGHAEESDRDHSPTLRFACSAGAEDTVNGHWDAQVGGQLNTWRGLGGVCLVVEACSAEADELGVSADR
jgi:hypothetical protein